MGLKNILRIRSAQLTEKRIARKQKIGPGLSSGFLSGSTSLGAFTLLRYLVYWIRRFVKFIILLALFSTAAFAHDLSYGPYIKMQESLAADDFKTSLEAHRFICDRELIHYKDDYKDCGKNFKDIEDLRKSFKELSEVYLANGDRKEIQTLIKASCPMAKAKWVQKIGELHNPYHGKSMLECGEKI